jgi:excisionase family DNA binding protein
MREGLLTAQELADALAVSRGTVIRWAKQGAIPELRPSPRTRRFDYTQVIAALQGRREQGAHREE